MIKQYDGTIYHERKNLKALGEYAKAHYQYGLLHLGDPKDPSISIPQASASFTNALWYAARASHGKLVESAARQLLQIAEETQDSRLLYLITELIKKQPSAPSHNLSSLKSMVAPLLPSRAYGIVN